MAGEGPSSCLPLFPSVLHFRFRHSQILVFPEEPMDAHQQVLLGPHCEGNKRNLIVSTELLRASALTTHFADDPQRPSFAVMGSWFLRENFKALFRFLVEI